MIDIQIVYLLLTTNKMNKNVLAVGHLVQCRRWNARRNKYYILCAIRYDIRLEFQMKRKFVAKLYQFSFYFNQNMTSGKQTHINRCQPFNHLKIIEKYYYETQREMRKRISIQKQYMKQIYERNHIH